MGTEQGAKARGVTELGVLACGKQADLIAVKLDTPTPINEHNVYDQLVLFRNPGDISHVMAAGKWLKYDGRLLTMDRQAVLEKLRCVTEKFWKPEE